MATFSTRAVLCLIFFISCASVPSLATVYTVGDSAGWALGVDYDTWASSKTFTVGDSLKFNYPSGHSVDEVSASDYGTCTIGNAITSDSTGTTTISLKAAGTHYFICGVVGHCGGGMKLSVKVTEAASATPAAPGGSGSGSTTTSPSTTISPATPAGTTITPPAATNTEAIPSSSGTISPYAAVFVPGIAVIYSLVLS